MLSPMMQQYMDTKKEYADCILFYRLGDFYEVFFDDALVASKELELTLTGKDCGMEERAPMCGVPFHAVDSYINKLVKHGHKVAIAEQMEDPKLAKGIVKREVIRVVTPGTITGSQNLDETRNNYLCGIAYVGGSFGIAMADYSTGDFLVTEAGSVRQLFDELCKYMPTEILINRELEMSGADPNEMRSRLEAPVEIPDDSFFSEESAQRLLTEHYGVMSIEGLGLKDYPAGTLAAGAVMRYLYDTQKNACGNLTSIQVYRTGEYMIIDSGTRRNLELTETMRSKERKGSLLWVLDKTGTAMGARLLRNSIEQPLIDPAKIIRRQDAVQELLEEFISREELREYINPIYDLERLMGRVSSGLAGPRDLIALKSSLAMLPAIKGVLSSMQSELLKEIYAGIDVLDDIRDLIDQAIQDDPPLAMRDGNIIRTGYNSEVDRLRSARTEGKNWLAQLEAREREKTGIKTLKVKYSKVFGYCIEVTNTFKDMVPETYIRKQTLVGCERYMTDELKELEDMILGAEDRLISLEYDLFSEVRERTAHEVRRIQLSAKAVAEADMLVSLAQAAYQNNYVRPSINEKGRIKIKDGRHPVVEKILGGDRFISNDTTLDCDKNRFSIITGPNMAGKSTYMRQVALIVLMAQTGSFVPASSAEIGICDRIFTRVGASDDLAAGQSTFMVEMTEVANILRNATRSSLIIMDEIGRGTSTFDGLSIAWAVVEHISDKKILGARTLFATHYHELTELEGSLDGVLNYCIAVREQGDSIVFLRKIVKGGADKSYGIQVAKLAGVPEPVLRRAKELAAQFEMEDRARIPAGCANDLETGQMSLFDTVPNDEIVDEIGEMDLSAMTPIDALNTLYRLQGRINNRIKL